MPRLGLGSLELSSLGGTGQDVVTTIDDFFFESDTSGEVTPIYTASRKQFARNNNDVAGLNNVTKDTSITAPPGQTGTAIRLTEDTATSQHFATVIIDEVTAGDTYTMSLYVKSTYSQIIIYTNTTQISSNVNVNFTNKTIATNALRAGIEDAGGGWYRVNWTQVAQASGSSVIYLVVKDLNSYTGNTSNFTDYFGMQVEQDSRASSFMLNTTSDVLTVSTTLNDTSEVWDFDSTDIMLEADPEDEGFWEEGSNIVLNGDYEELGSELASFSDNNIVFTDLSDSTTISLGSNSYRSEAFGNTNDSRPRVTVNGSGIVTGKTYKVVYTPTSFTGSTVFDFWQNGSRFVNNHDASLPLTFYFVASNSFDGFDFDGSQTFRSDYTLSIKQVDPNDRWTLGTGWSIEDGKAVHEGGSSNTYLEQQNITTIGSVYEAVFTLSGSLNATNYIQVYGSSSYTISPNKYTSAGTYTLYFTADATYFRFRAVSPDNDISIDNVTVREYAIQPQDV